MARDQDWCSLREVLREIMEFDQIVDPEILSESKLSFVCRQMNVQPSEYTCFTFYFRTTLWIQEIKNII